MANYSFYEVQLFVLAVFCGLAMLLDRYASRNKDTYGLADGGIELNGARVPLKDEDELEEIEGALGAASSGNGYHAVNAMNREPGTAAQLGKIYLIVYAVVMGE